MLEPDSLPTASPSMILKTCLAVSALEGLVAALLVFRTPSEAGSAAWLGFSPARLALGAAGLALAGSLAFLAAAAWLRPGAAARWSDQIERWLAPGRRLLSVFIVLAYLVLLVLLAWPLFHSEFGRSLGPLVGFFDRGQSLLVWFGLLALQAGLGLGVAFPHLWRREGYFQAAVLGKVSLLVAILLATGFHWCILAFQLPVFQSIPDWFWPFLRKDLLPRHLWFAALLLATLGAGWYLSRRPGNHTLRTFLLLAGLGYLLQLGFGVLAGGGYESLREKYALSYHNRYALYAADQPQLLTALREYDTRYGWDISLGTKPPGILGFYILTQKVSNLVRPETTYDGRVYRLTACAAVLFPALAMAVLAALGAISRRILPPEDRFLPGLLYCTAPSFLLMPLFPDQVLYPGMFMLGLWLCGWAYERQSPGLAAAAGAYVFLALYFSFSLLPLLPLAGLWLALMEVRRHGLRRWKKEAGLLLCLFAGLLAAGLVFRLGLNYDPLLRYHNAMQLHRQMKTFEPGLASLLAALRVNLVDFAAWSGFPLALLATAGVLSSLVAWVRRWTAPAGAGTPSDSAAARLDELMVAFLASFLALNLLGQTHGEVGRLWLFLLPLVAIAAVIPLQRWYGKHSAIPALVL
ncbi:MAG: hypothetical protein GYA17_19240, partial [Chloroflexi bacterium]|nr:hypothetical protein [Chloroflexota bacterium]